MSFFIAVFLLLSFSACRSTVGAGELMSEFMSAYGISGPVFLPDEPEYSEGYISEDALKKIYSYYGSFPSDYAIFLNRHYDYGAECAFFVCDDGDISDTLEMCYERIALICRGEEGIVLCSQNVVFYSTLSDKERARELFFMILK